MTKDEVLNSAKIFLEINGQDKRLVTSLKKSLEALFENNETKIPFESLAVAELNDRRNRFEKAQTNKFISDTAKEAMKKAIFKIENRIKDLS